MSVYFMDSSGDRDQRLSVLRSNVVSDQPQAGTFAVAAWNIERGRDVESIARLLAETSAQVICLSEVDIGMARSGNIDVVQEIAATLGFSFYFATEFIELGHGIALDQDRFAGLGNNEALHGNAIICQGELHNVRLLRFDDGTIWREQAWHTDRIGSRCALMGVLETAGGVVLIVSTHLESMPGPERRRRHMAALLDFIDEHYGPIPIIIAGDMNTSELPEACDRDQPVLPQWFSAPADLEPLFDELGRHRVEWQNANTTQHTRRSLWHGLPARPFKRVDWIFTRGLEVSSPRVVPAVDRSGGALSDHELVLCFCGNSRPLKHRELWS